MKTIRTIRMVLVIRFLIISRPSTKHQELNTRHSTAPHSLHFIFCFHYKQIPYHIEAFGNYCNNNNLIQSMPMGLVSARTTSSSSINDSIRLLGYCLIRLFNSLATFCRLLFVLSFPIPDRQHKTHKK